MQRGPDPWRRLVLAHLEDASGGLDLITGTPSSDKGSCEGRITEIDRQGVVQQATCSRRRHRPAVGTGILVEPCFDPVEPRTKPVWRNSNPNAYREASFCLGYHEPGASGHWCVPFLF